MATVTRGGLILVSLIGLTAVTRSFWLEASFSRSASNASLAPRFELDLNTAAVAELRALPEIGERLAERIVQDRVRHGAYSEPDQLTRVHGLGPATLEQIRPYLRCSP